MVDDGNEILLVAFYWDVLSVTGLFVTIICAEPYYLMILEHPRERNGGCATRKRTEACSGVGITCSSIATA
jgi:hypothetical protein